MRMEPTNHLGQSYNKQPDVNADNIGRGGRHFCGDVKMVCPLSSNRVEGHGPYCERRERGGVGGGGGEGYGGMAWRG